MNARDGTPSVGPDALRAEARASAAEVLLWGTGGHQPPAVDAAVSAMNRLNSYGADLRDALNARCSEMPTGSGPYRSAEAILGEASRRLGQPPLGGKDAVVRRAQNLARLVDGLLRALGYEEDTAARSREPPS
ncbi:DUF6415 family natural product biosynthesis protein [Streptomyces microflavus]|uniref:DUF6415 family natural product biosynthesis protein n=1 Tax=Streptomyces microflavus TaxID=1919 RepID=UPI003818AD7D